ncbi:MAG TPA: class I SAM-dependent methyltransferase [Gaiellaceae bacterium]|nr:class I SAM-dependent methyltransferase [Gaiellaceae bacterium]
MDKDIRAYYEVGDEQERLSTHGWLEFARTKELLLRHLPTTPARVLDVGGGPGAYAAWLADRGYSVHLVDPVPLHVEQAAEVAQVSGRHFSVAQGDARRLDEDVGSFDAVLVLGPLYHLVERADRLKALAEARRVLVRGGIIAVAAISRFASIIDGVARELLLDPKFRPMVEDALRLGEHRNPARIPRAFTTSFFHRPDELSAEVADAGFVVDAVYAIEGPAGWFAPSSPPDERSAEYEMLLWVARAVEQEPSLLGGSAHLLAVGHVLE